MRRPPIRLFVLALVLLTGSLLAGPLCWPAGATTVTDNPATDGTECTTDSTQTVVNGKQTGITLIYSLPCESSVAMATTRIQQVSGGGEVEVMVPYMVHNPPSGTPTKAIAVLLTGGDGCAGILSHDTYASYPLTPENLCANDTDPAMDTRPYRNFLIRSAALFAQHGFKAITIDRPLNVNPPNPTYLDYRRSQVHALDIAGVVAQENPDNKAVFLVGTSNGTLSAFAQSVMGTASMLSSPITDVSTEHLEDGVEPEFQPAWLVTSAVSMPVPVPVQILEHKGDPCLVSPPSGAKTLSDDLISAGVTDTVFHRVTGGFVDTDNGSDQDLICGALSFHGFLGIEREVVQRITRRMTLFLNGINSAYPNTHRPVAGNGSLSTPSPDTQVSLELTAVATDSDLEPLTFALPHLKSARGADLTLSGMTVTYDASHAGFTGPATVHDSFVYVAAEHDGGGKRSFGVITVTVTVP